MSLPQRLAAYDDCREVFDRATANPHGTRVAFKTYGEAHIFSLRMHTCRKLERDEMARIYDAMDTRWGKTEWDHLMVRKPADDGNGLWWVYVEPQGKNIVVVEDLTAEDAT